MKRISQIQKYVIALLMLGSLVAQATDYTWKGGGTVPNAWYGGGNWSPAVVPTAADTAIFDATSTDYLTITLNNTATNYLMANIRLTSPGGNVVITNGNSARLGNVDMSAATKDLTVINTSINGRLGRNTDAALAFNVASGRTLTYSCLGSLLVDRNMTLNLTGSGTVNMQVPSFDMGREQTVATSPKAVTTVNISAGELSGFTNFRMWGITNVVNQTGGLVSIGDGTSGSLTMAQSSTANGYDNTYNLRGGTLRLEKGVNVNTAASSGGKTTLVFDGGTLETLAGGNTYIAGGTVANGIDGVRIDAAGAILNMNNTFSIYPNITGTGGLTKIGIGALYLQGTNSYTGNTLISGGLLSIGAMKSIASTNVTVASGARLYLNNSTTLSALTDLIIATDGLVNLVFTGTNAINRLSLDGGNSWVAPGVYGAEHSNIGSTGVLFVAIPESATLGLFAIASGCILLHRR